MIRAADVVIDFLEAEQARGVTHVYLDEGARDGLRAWYRRRQSGSATRVASSPEAVASPAPRAAQASQMTVDPAPPMMPLIAEGASKAECLASLRQQAAACAPARALGTLREKLVFAAGNPDARLMLVGEAPGHEEEKKGEPFVGPAGQKLDEILKAMGLSRADVYLSYILKFRTATARQTTNNRKPSPAEMEVCLPFIRAEISIVRPACIIALGGSAAEGLLGLSGDVVDMRGSWHAYEGIPVRVTYPPAYLLQTRESLPIKRQVWEDMLAVMESLGMPVSERQRAFFPLG